MALVSGEPEYSSPAKRLKLDQTQHLSNSNVELDFGAYSAPLKKVHEVIKGQYTMSAEALCADSRFNETSSVLCSVSNGQSGSSGQQTSPHSSLKEKDSEELHKNTLRDAEEDDDDDDDDEKDEVSSTVSNLSNLSGLSDLSGQEWKPMAGPMSWIQKQMLVGVNPRVILNQLMGSNTPVPPAMDDLTLWRIIANMLSEPPRREKLQHINTLGDVVNLLRRAKKIIVLTGAGVSVSCGIPDFRSRDGIYSRLALDFPDLPDPQAMFDIQYFSQDPRPFFKFAREIYPGQFKPSPCHRFIKMLEKHNKLLRNYSQNIDTLEQVAGIRNVIECHGSFATASCTRCKYKVTADAIRDDIFAQKIPLCPRCSNNAQPHTIDNERYSEDYRELVQQGIMKPDIVFFGEGLPDLFHESMANDKDECDLLIVIGSSLKVRPVALIPSSVPAHVPQILINREPLPHFTFDVKLLGDSDVIINQICHMLGDDWKEVCWRPPLVEAHHLLPASHSRRDSCNESWGPHRHPSTSSMGAECAKEAAPSIKDSLTEGSCSPNPGDQGSNVESSEADSLQMSIDSGMGMSADSSCSTLKERHMSVDSSTRDSGVCFSADSPAENNSSWHFTMMDSSKDCRQDNTEIPNESRNGPSGVSSSSGNRNDQERENPPDSSSRPEPSDCTSLNRHCTVLIDSSSVLGDNGAHASTSTCKGPAAQVQTATADSSCSSAGSNVSSSSAATVKHRQMSVESMKDSGIGDGINSVDSTANSSQAAAQNSKVERRMSVDSSDEAPKDDDIEALRACWQPKVRESLAARLPEHSYYFLPPNTYLFPGAEVYSRGNRPSVLWSDVGGDENTNRHQGSGSSSDSSDSEASDESDVEEGEAESWAGAGSAEKIVKGQYP